MAVADFTDGDPCPAVAEAAAQTAPITILVNNTGGPAGGPAHAADPAAYLAAFSQHLLCNQRMVQALLPGMRSAGGGRIVNVISTSVKQPLDGLGVSNTVRGAVANWAKTLANELGPDGITVNNVLPGATRTARLQQIAEAKSAKTGDPRRGGAFRHGAGGAAQAPGRGPRDRCSHCVSVQPCGRVHQWNQPARGRRTDSVDGGP